MGVRLVLRLVSHIDVLKPLLEWNTTRKPLLWTRNLTINFNIAVGFYYDGRFRKPWEKESYRKLRPLLIHQAHEPTN